MAAALATAATLDATGATREEDLAALRARMGELQAELDRKESTRRESRDALRASETALSELNRSLRELDAKGRELAARQREADARARAGERALAERRAAIGRLLAATYAAGAPGALRLVLAGEDPAESARKLHYASLVAGASARALDAYRAGLRELDALRRSAGEEASALEALELQRRAERERALAERRERQKVLERIAGDLRKGRRELKVLQADEARLARVIEEIGRLLAARPGAGHAARPAPARRGAPAAADPSPFPAGAFATLRGRLRLPVRGELAARFGAQAGDGGPARKGVFIRSPEGEAVRSVAAGRVVYADWMRGFGNLIIVDHGDAYLSVYGNNEALLKRPGDDVAAGEALATVGATGGNPETGLYFELRHLGKAFDPLRWIGR